MEESLAYELGRALAVIDFAVYLCGEKKYSKEDVLTYLTKARVEVGTMATSLLELEKAT